MEYFVVIQKAKESDPEEKVLYFHSVETLHEWIEDHPSSEDLRYIVYKGIMIINWS